MKALLQKLLSALWKLASKAAVLAVLALVAGALALGYVAGRRGAGTGPSQSDGPAAQHRHTAEKPEQEPAKAEVWTCSMHPQVRLPKPGKCPICGMTLIPLTGAGDEGERVLAVSPAAAALAEIQTTKVERKFVEAQVRMVGKVDYDETRLAYITAWVPGRLDKLYVDYTGVPVKKGEHMVYLYSPDLYAAQEELLQALKVVEELKNSQLEPMRETAAATVVAVREKLRLLGLKPEQIAEVERTQKPTDHLTIYAPGGGIVIHKNAIEGMYVQTGTKIYTIADLSRVWVKLDAYESDLPWIRYGQRLAFETDAHPGRPFTGTIAFIDPILDARTRTVKVRLNVDNPHGQLKPGMFVRAVLRATIDADGRVVEPRLAGKWICSMHPEVLRDEAGLCDLCEMPLVRTEELGFAGPSKPSRPPLVIPASAALSTGRRAVAFVRIPGKKRPTFEHREVVLGPRAGLYYVVHDGVKAGELVVTRGNFKLDAERQIQSKRSMMSMPDSLIAGALPSRLARLEVPQPFREQLTAFLDTYLAIWRALAADDAAAATAAAKQSLEALASVDMKPLKGEAHTAWMREQANLEKAARQLIAAKAIQGQREAFDLLSQALAPALKRFGHAAKTTIRRFHCPMAFNNRGASWLQDAEGTLNPYFGAAMPKCGEQKDVIETPGAQAAAREPVETSEAFRTQLTALLGAYLDAGKALAGDDPKAASEAGKRLTDTLAAVDMKPLKGPAHMAWMKAQTPLGDAVKQFVKAAGLAGQREAFDLLSKALTGALRRFGHASKKPIIVFRCSMAFDNRGADWLQDSEETRNPYFGAKMPGCGDAVGRVEGRGSRVEGEEPQRP